MAEDGDATRGGRPRRKPGFDLKFSPLPLELITDDVRGEPMRSSYVDGTIVIYMEHPDFKERIERTRSGRTKLGARLARERRAKNAHVARPVPFSDSYYCLALLVQEVQDRQWSTPFACLEVISRLFVHAIVPSVLPTRR